MKFSSDLKIPKKKRSKFSNPLGKLIAGSRKETISKLEIKFRKKAERRNEFRFFLVGDIVTKDFLENDFLRRYVKLCIIDEKTQRNRIKVSQEGFFENIIEFENPAGIISKESWSFLEKAVKSEKKTLIKIVKGEEDLLVLPLVIILPISKKKLNYIVYGQPPITDAENSIPEGIVIVKNTDPIKKAVKHYIDLMEKVA
ncbi:MAG: hypothetical protein BAJALOKI2v1_30055 [Promethearchaeota archaeon]|nr:MAG: hypothetical protein BAJALOKI2v1_30055 [Candidatus Lokiarchaeota archaeon]